MPHSLWMRVIKALLWGTAVVAFAYLFVWGVTWLLGDRSLAYPTITLPHSLYFPGVFLGGLPPVPAPDADLELLAATIVGALGVLLGLLLVVTRRVRGVKTD
jgi:hypothetical protein